MNLLALDTSSIACSVAISMDGEVFHRHTEQARAHTRLLIPMIEELLQETKLTLPDLDGIVLGNGPGSFIGMRIATSVAQGLAHASGLPIFPVSSLAAVAADALQHTSATCVAVAQDAHMNEVYFGLYQSGDFDFPEAMVDERLQGHGLIKELLDDSVSPVDYAGLGWQRYPEFLAVNRKYLKDATAAFVPRAEILIGLAAMADPVAPADVVPAYLRQQVAMQPQKRET